jgi:xanthine phosphoribosyltransferase
MQKVKLEKSVLLDAIKSIARKVKELQPDVVVAIERGGIPLGVYLSSYLNIPLEKVKVSYYDDTTKLEIPRVSFKDFEITDYTNPLFVDDLVDTGSTMNFIKEKFGRVTFATLYCSDTVKPDAYCFHKKADEWIVFPWDLENDGFDVQYTKEGWWK